jgi:hypothetical protein
VSIAIAADAKMTDPWERCLSSLLNRIRKVQQTRAWAEYEIAEIYRSTRPARLNVGQLKEAAKAIFAELHGRTNDQLQNSGAEERAKTEVTVPPELGGYNDGFGQLYAESKLAMDDPIGK